VEAEVCLLENAFHWELICVQRFPLADGALHSMFMYEYVRTYICIVNLCIICTSRGYLCALAPSRVSVFSF